MREIVSPLSGIRSPFRSEASEGWDGGAAAVSYLGAEGNGMVLDFTSNGYAIRTLDADFLIVNESQGFALELLSNTYSVRAV